MSSTAARAFDDRYDRRYMDVNASGGFAELDPYSVSLVIDQLVMERILLDEEFKVLRPEDPDVITEMAKLKGQMEYVERLGRALSARLADMRSETTTQSAIIAPAETAHDDLEDD